MIVLRDCDREHDSAWDFDCDWDGNCDCDHDRNCDRDYDCNSDFDCEQCNCDSDWQWLSLQPIFS